MNLISLTFLVLLVAKLLGSDLSWWWVTCPFWGGFLLVFVLSLIQAWCREHGGD